MKSRRQRTLGIVVLCATLAGACTGGDSADTAAPSTTEAPPATTTSTTTAGPACSADGLPAATSPRTNLSDGAEATRLAIIDAALQCDFAALASLAAAGDRPFDSGSDIDPADLWSQQELEGLAPMRTLATLLRGAMGTVAVGGIEYRFPSAAGFSDWSEVPTGLREALAPLYGPEDFGRFEAAGVYDGYRTAIADSGEWLYYYEGS